MNSPSVGQLLALMLALIMLYLGLTLQVADFKRVWQRPTALAAGLTGQLLMLPLLGFVVANWLSLDPLMAVGLMVLVACPGGVSSGLLTHLARGEVALSISLTAVTSVAAMLTLPLVVNLSMHFFLAQSDPVAFDLATMVRSIFLLTTLPVLIGMGLRQWQPEPVLRLLPAAARLATGLFVLIVLVTFWEQRQTLMTQLPTLGSACVLLNSLVLLGAWVVSRAFGLGAAERTAVVTECGLQNAALGIYVCVQLLHTPAMSAPSIVYALLMNGGALAFVYFVRAKSPSAGLTRGPNPLSSP